MEGNQIRLVILSKQKLETGTSKSSGKEWQKQSYVGETLDKFPKKVFFSFFGDSSITYNQLEVGSTYDISVDIESRSFVGRDGVERWMTDVKAFKSEKVDITPTVPQTPPQTQQNYDRQAEAYFNGQPTPQQVNIPTQSEVMPF